MAKNKSKESRKDKSAEVGAPTAAPKASSNTRLAQPLGSTRNSLPEKTRMKVASILAIHTVSAIDLFLQSKQAHWNVNGKNFHSIHALFDELAAASQSWADLLAERVRQLGFEALGSARAIVEHSRITEYPTQISTSSDHLAAVADRLAEFAKGIRAAIDQCAKLGDADGADICTEVSSAADKLLWMVEAHLQ